MMKGEKEAEVKMGAKPAADSLSDTRSLDPSLLPYPMRERPTIAGVDVPTLTLKVRGEAVCESKKQVREACIETADLMRVQVKGPER